VYRSNGKVESKKHWEEVKFHGEMSGDQRNNHT
jgi:hypothetical protein